MKLFIYAACLLNFVFIFSIHKNIILVGPPGVGKGTLAAFLKENYGYFHISGGDIIRAQIKQGTELGKQFQKFIVNADPVPAQFAHDFINKPEMDKALLLNKPFIVDGFILSADHKNVLLEYLKEKNILANTVVFYLNAPDHVVIERVISRMICKECQKNFNKAAVECDVCHVPLIARDDQKIIMQRLSKYHKNIEPVITSLSEDFQVIKINTEFPFEQSAKIYENLLSEAHIL